MLFCEKSLENNILTSFQRNKKVAQNFFLSYSFAFAKTTFYNKNVENTCEKVTSFIYPPQRSFCSPCPMSKANNRAKCGIYSKLTANTSGRQWSRSSVFGVNFKQISHFFLVLRTMVLNRQISTYLMYNTNTLIYKYIILNRPIHNARR